jgi:hypothetical protein
VSPLEHGPVGGSLPWRVHRQARRSCAAEIPAEVAAAACPPCGADEPLAEPNT